MGHFLIRAKTFCYLIRDIYGLPFSQLSFAVSLSAALFLCPSMLLQPQVGPSCQLIPPKSRKIIQKQATEQYFGVVY